MKGVFKTTASGSRGSEVEMVARREIPFVPSVGDMLAVAPHGDYWCVDDVFWHCERPDEIEVFVSSTNGISTVSYMRAQGWEKAELQP